MPVSVTTVDVPTTRLMGLMAMMLVLVGTLRAKEAFNLPEEIFFILKAILPTAVRLTPVCAVHEAAPSSEKHTVYSCAVVSADSSTCMGEAVNVTAEDTKAVQPESEAKFMQVVPLGE